MRETTINERTMAAQGQYIAEQSHAFDKMGVHFFSVFGIPNLDEPCKGQTFIETNCADDLDMIQLTRKRANEALDKLEQEYHERKKQCDPSTPKTEKS